MTASNNKLICKSKEEIEKEIMEAIEVIEILITDKESQKDLNIEEINKHIEKLKDELLEIDEERYYLVSSDNKNLVDFYNKYNSTEVVALEHERHNLIEIRYENENSDFVITLVNFNGNEVVEQCNNYTFIGENEEYILIEQKGSMLGMHYDHRNVLLYSIVDTDITEKLSIEFNEIEQLYIIDGKEKYNKDLEYIGDL